MGCGEKTTTQNSQTATQTPEEKALMQQQISNNNFMMPYAQKNYASLSDNINAILQGNQPMAKGINGVDENQTTNMAQAAVRDVLPQFQQAGILDSGAAFQGATRAAADVRNQNAQFNVSAAQNLFNLAAGGQSNLQGQYQGSTNNLTNQLAGLRTTNTSGSTIGMNPFLKSFEQSMGQLPTTIVNAAGTAASGGGKLAGGFCWVAAEIFGGWHNPKTIMARFFISNMAPKWFKEFYIKYGECVANFISDKPILKVVLRPLFELFVLIAETEVCYGR